MGWNSTGMGDLPGSPGVVPTFFVFQLHIFPKTGPMKPKNTRFATPSPLHHSATPDGGTLISCDSLFALISPSRARAFRSIHHAYPDAPFFFVVRSYLGYYTGSHPNSAVKRLWAGIVVGWVTSREVPLSYPNSSLFHFILSTKNGPD